MSTGFISTFEIFKLSIGPSSSHAMGPMLAASDFVKLIQDERVTDGQLKVHLYGSLALTGRGHQADKAIVLSLQGISPSTLKQQNILDLTSQFEAHLIFKISGLPAIKFTPVKDIHFHENEWLSEHLNGLRFELTTLNQSVISRTYFSIGGGFIKTKEEFDQLQDQNSESIRIPLPFRNANDLLNLTTNMSLPIDEVVFRNELKFRSKESIDELTHELNNAMHECLGRGLIPTDILPGSLKLKRRAPSIFLISTLKIQRIHLKRPID